VAFVSSLTAIDDKRGWEAILRIVEGIPDEPNRTQVRAFLEERRANGIKLTRLGIDATAMRGLCLHLGEKKLQDVAKADCITYLNNAKSIRAWRVKDKQGKETVTRKHIKLGMDTMGHRKGVFKVLSAGCVGPRTTRRRSRG
jgi:hypothetical protein